MSTPTICTEITGSGPSPTRISPTRPAQFRTLPSTSRAASIPGGALIVPWFRAASREAVRFLSGSTSGTRAESRSVLTRRSSLSNRWSLRATSGSASAFGPVVLQADLVLLLQERPELVVVEPLGVLEAGPHHVGERLLAVGHLVPEVAAGDQVADPERVPLLDQELEHDLQRRPLALEDAGDGHQRLHQGRAEGVDHPEHLAVAVVGQQGLHDLGPDLDRLLEGPLQLRPCSRRPSACRTRFSAISGRLRSSRTMVWNRPSQWRRASAKLSWSAPGAFLPTRSRRSRWRATKLTIGIGRSGVCDSTSLASFWPSWWTKSGRAACEASQRISSSRNRIRPS